MLLKKIDPKKSILQGALGIIAWGTSLQDF